MVEVCSTGHREGSFADESIWSDATHLPAYKWWQTHGQEVQELMHVAVRILSLGSSAGAAERAWSAMDFVHTKRRNRLVPARVSALVYVFQVRIIRTRCQHRMPAFRDVVGVRLVGVAGGCRLWAPSRTAGWAHALRLSGMTSGSVLSLIIPP